MIKTKFKRAKNSTVAKGLFIAYIVIMSWCIGLMWVNNKHWLWNIPLTIGGAVCYIMSIPLLEEATS